MKNNFRKIAALILALMLCVFALAACNETPEAEEPTAVKITEEAIKSELSDSDGELNGTLTIDKGTAEDVKAFSYVVKGITASNMSNKTYLKNAVTILMNNPGNITMGQLRDVAAFTATTGVIAVFNEDEEGEFNANAFIDEVLEIICDGATKAYSDWNISATVDETTNSITIKAVYAGG